MIGMPRQHDEQIDVRGGGHRPPRKRPVDDHADQIRPQSGPDRLNDAGRGIEPGRARGRKRAAAPVIERDTRRCGIFPQETVELRIESEDKPAGGRRAACRQRAPANRPSGRSNTAASSFHDTIRGDLAANGPPNLRRLPEPASTHRFCCGGPGSNPLVPPRRLAALDGLRGLAVLFVLLSHACKHFPVIHPALDFRARASSASTCSSCSRRICSTGRSRWR